MSLRKQPVQIRVIAESERERFDKLMGEYHYLGERHSGGDTLRMVAERDGEWVGLLMWGRRCANCLGCGRKHSVTSGEAYREALIPPLRSLLRAQILIRQTSGVHRLCSTKQGNLVTEI